MAKKAKKAKKATKKKAKQAAKITLPACSLPGWSLLRPGVG
jgi:hypothetical protein